MRGLKPEDMHYEGTSEHLSEVWVAVRAALRHVLERVSLRDVVDGKLPRDIRASLSNPDAWTRR